MFNAELAAFVLHRAVLQSTIIYRQSIDDLRSEGAALAVAEKGRSQFSATYANHLNLLPTERIGPQIGPHFNSLADAIAGPWTKTGNSLITAPTWEMGLAPRFALGDYPSGAKERHLRIFSRMVNMSPRFIILVLAMFATFAPARESAAEARDAAALFIEGLAQRAIELMKREDLAPAQREEEVRALLNDGFQMRMIARAVLGRNWRRASTEQQGEFLALFSDYVVKTYAKRLGAFTGQSLNVNRSVPINEKETIVQTSLQGNSGPDTRIDWRVRQIKDQPRIIDVVVEGVSMLTTQRSTYTSVVARKGVDGVLISMREVADKSAN